MYGAETLEVQINDSLMKKIRDAITERKIFDYDIDISAGSAKGDNFLGGIVKLTIQDAPRKKILLNWIAKSAPTGELVRKALDIVAVYEREIYVYEKLFPMFAKMQDERAVLRPFDSYAHYVLSHVEPMRESLVMEDMKSIGYVMRDKKEPLDYDHVKLVMEAYGKLHALSFALRDQNPEEFAKVAKKTEEEFFAKLNRGKEIMERQKMFRSKVIATMDPIEDADAIEVYKLFAKNDFDLVLREMKVTNQYSVIGHGDSWVNNMLFKYENKQHPNRPTKVCLLDWQLCRYGSPAFDLSYFIFTCTDKALRDQHYDHMIKLYYHSLCKHLVDLGSDPEKLFPFSALQSELQRGSIFGFHMTVMVTHLMMSEADEVPDIQNAKSDTPMSVMNYNSVNESMYKERIHGVVLDFVKNGYFDIARM